MLLFVFRCKNSRIPTPCSTDLLYYSVLSNFFVKSGECYRWPEGCEINIFAVLSLSKKAKWFDAGQSGIPALTKNTLCMSTLQTEGSGKWYILHVHRRLLLVLSAVWCWKIIRKCRKAGEKLVRHRHFLPAVNFFSPASAFQHQGQSGTAGHRLVRHCPAMVQY